MAASIGIHVGATSCCVAVYKADKAEVVANEAGDRTTPSLIAFTGSEKIVGLAAKQGRIRNALNTVSHMKLLIGKKYEDNEVATVINKCSCKIVNINDCPFYEVEEEGKAKKVTAKEMMRLLLKKLFSIAQVHGDSSEIKDAVFTVPFNYTGEQKDIIREMAKQAGFKVLRVISEPAAAALAYQIGQDNPTEYSNILVYCLGGTTLDITVINVNSGMYRVVANRSSHLIGGDQFTNALVEHCASEFKRQWKTDVLGNSRAVAKLKSACETCKHALSTVSTSTVSIESLCEGIDFQSNISRARFESMCSSYFQQCVQPISEILGSIGLDGSNIHKVILVGGTTRTPKLQQMIKDSFGQAEILNSIAPDEAISLGAALQAALLDNSADDVLNEEYKEMECYPKALMIKTQLEDGSSHLYTMIAKCTPVPVRRQHDFVVPGYQSSVCVEVLEGDSDSLAEGATLLGKVVLTDLLPSDEKRLIHVVLHIRREGSLHLMCSDRTDGLNGSINVEQKVPGHPIV